MNKPIKYIQSTAVPFPMENIDTDQIIPARFLKAVNKHGFGDNLFRDWRYDKGSNLNEHFVLNNPMYSGEILLAGKNFGCGSSREHAAWAVAQYGFKAVVSSYFADIFKNNALNNGLLIVEVSEQYLSQMFEAVESDPKTLFEINVESQQITNSARNSTYKFELDPFKKDCLITGKDDLDYLLGLDNQIKKFETNQTIY